MLWIEYEPADAEYKRAMAREAIMQEIRGAIARPLAMDLSGRIQPITPAQQETAPKQTAATVTPFRKNTPSPKQTPPQRPAPAQPLRPAATALDLVKCAPRLRHLPIMAGGDAQGLAEHSGFARDLIGAVEQAPSLSKREKLELLEKFARR